MTLATTANWDAGAEARFASTIRWYADIIYSGGTLYLATEAGVFGSNTYTANLLGVSEITYGVGDIEFFAQPATCKLRIARNATIDNAFDVDSLYGNVVTLTARAGSIGSLVVGRLRIRGHEVVSRGEIVLDCEQALDLFKDIPVGVISDYASLDSQLTKSTEYDGTLHKPLIFGTMGATTLADGTGYPLACLRPKACGVRILGTGKPGSTWPGMTYFYLCENGSGPPTIALWAVEYLPGWDRYALLEKTTTAIDTPSGTDIFTIDDTTTADIWLGLGSSASIVDAECRLLSVTPDGEYAVTTGGNQNKIGDWTSTTNPGLFGSVTLNATNNNLCLTLNRNGGEPEDFKSFIGVNITFTADVLAGTVNVYEGTISTDAKGASIGSTAGSTLYRFALASSFDKSDRFFLLQYTGASSITVTGLALEFRYRRSMQQVQKYYLGNTETREGTLGHYTRRVVFNYATNITHTPPNPTTMFAPYDGPDAVIQPGSISYAYNSPIYIIYYVLNTTLGFSTSQINAASFDAAYTYLITDTAARFNNWSFGRQFMEQIASIDMVADFARLCGLIPFLSADGTWKLALHNQAGTPVETFSDISTDFPCKDLIWDWSQAYASRFRFNWQWNPGPQQFTQHLLVNKDISVSAFLSNAKTQCTNAFNNYGADVTAEDLDLFWVWDSATAENVAKIFINYMAVRRRKIRFKSKISAAKLEIGDTIRTFHLSQTWTTTKDFQVREVRIMEGGVVEITALEVNSL